jgi:hypothetical protein
MSLHVMYWCGALCCSVPFSASINNIIFNINLHEHFPSLIRRLGEFELRGVERLLHDAHALRHTGAAHVRFCRDLF